MTVRSSSPGFAFFALLLASVSAQDPARDDFERHLLGSSWTPNAGTGIVNNSDVGSATGTSCAARWSGSQFGADQWSEAELSANIDPALLTQVFARWRAADGARYGFHWNGDPGNSRWEIKYDGVPSAQTRILARVDGPGPQPGDSLRIEVDGRNPVVIRGYHRGQLKLRAVDGEPQRITEPGMPGLVSRPRTGSSVTPPISVFESWSGGTLTWLDRDNGLAGTNGVPSLTGSGTLIANSATTLQVTSGRAGAASALAIGLSPVYAPLLGGVLVPSPDLVAPLILDPAGGARVAFAWPAGTGSGFEMWSQAWIVDPAGPRGAAATNGLLARVR
jgi:hypothetical protein